MNISPLPSASPTPPQGDLRQVTSVLWTRVFSSITLDFTRWPPTSFPLQHSRIYLLCYLVYLDTSLPQLSKQLRVLIIIPPLKKKKSLQEIYKCPLDSKSFMKDISPPCHACMISVPWSAIKPTAMRARNSILTTREHPWRVFLITAYFQCPAQYLACSNTQ